MRNGVLTVLALAVLALGVLSGMRCGAPLILSIHPTEGAVVREPGFAVEVRLASGCDPASLGVTLNGLPLPMAPGSDGAHVLLRSHVIPFAHRVHPAPSISQMIVVSGSSCSTMTDAPSADKKRTGADASAGPVGPTA